MNADECRQAACDELGLSYPELGTQDPIRIAKAEALALLAIAEDLKAIVEELKDLRIDLSMRGAQ